MVVDSHLAEAAADSEVQEVADLEVHVVVDLGVQKVVDLAVETVSKMALVMTETEIGEALVVGGDKAQEAIRTLVIEMGGLGALVDVVVAEVGLVEVMTGKVALENQGKMVMAVLVVGLDVVVAEGAEGVGLEEAGILKKEMAMVSTYTMSFNTHVHSPA